MTLPRLQLFEFNDLAWVGPALRDSLVEALSRGQRWGRTLRGLVGPYGEFLEAAGTREVLDVCAGAGGPAQILTEEHRRAGIEPPQFVLSDLFPRVEAWRRLADAEPSISFHPEAVDATRIPAALSKGRARSIINAFHHFPPKLAGLILADAVRSRAPIWISEPFERNPLGFVSFAPFGLPALMANPVLTPEPSWAKAFLTWGLTPLTLSIGAWDGIVSTLRVYTEDELREMAERLGRGYRWTHGSFRYPLGGAGYYFWGVPA